MSHEPHTVPRIEDIKINEADFERHKTLPIYKKSLLLRKLTMEVTKLIDEEGDDYNLKQLMLEHAYMISAKIAGAQATELYSYRLENAFCIKRYANELMTELALCESKRIGDQRYIPLLQQQIEELRKMFVKWVDSFDKTRDVEDAWSLWQDYGGG